ncbi:MAG: phenylalanine--tRNA ligase subunit beta [Clostridia bacterium]
MKASLEWLKEYANIDVTAKQLADTLTMTGSKVETVEEQGNDIQNVVVGKILEIKPHQDSDHLVVTKVNVKDEILQIVTGANNIHEGDIVPIAKDGSKLPGGVEIKTGKLRGVDSCGMMCSVGELGLDINNYPGQIENGIMILDPKMESEIGKDIKEVLGINQVVLDFEITPNRPDCLSIEGLGREVAASLNEPFKAPRKNIDEMNVENKESVEGVTVEITAPDLCYRYIARVVKNVKIAPSPEWMTKRLNACGVRSINNIVDITNYVMLEMGQPMHAFDINSIEGKHITVRRANKGEKITTLDNQERTLTENMLVIADSKKPVAIAGVMGGQNSEIENNTQTVVFESAVFNGGSIRKTAKAVGLRTEASSRYEKGLSPENAIRAVNRAVELVELLGAGEAVEGKVDVYPTKQKVNKIPLDVERINSLIGTNLSKQQMVEILEKLEMKVEADTVIPPYFREDVEQLADVAEEVLRFYGYDKLGTTLINAETTLGGRNKEQKISDDIAKFLVNSGLSEICTFGFLSEKDLAKCNITGDNIYLKEAISIQNPLSEDYNLMKTTSVPSMMQMLANNNNYKNKNVKLFDLSRIYQNKNEAIQKGELPLESNILTIGMYSEDEDFYTLKGIVENVIEVAGVAKFDIKKEKENAMYHPGRCANFTVGNDVVATFGEANPLLTKNYDITQRILLAEINLDKLTRYSRKNKKYAPITKFPAIERDIAMVLNEEVEVGEIEKIIQKKAKKNLEEAKLFDVYRSEKLGQNKKSVAYSLKFRVPDRTLKDEEVNGIMKEIIAELEKTLGAELRK